MTFLRRYFVLYFGGWFSSALIIDVDHEENEYAELVFSEKVTIARILLTKGRILTFIGEASSFLRQSLLAILDSEVL